MEEQQPAAQPPPYSDELLVDLVRARDILYDKGRVDYKDEEAKAAAWESVADTLGMRVEDCQTRWVRLRERFGRELRGHKRRVPASKTWFLFPRMAWLERFIQPRNRIAGAKASSNRVNPTRGLAGRGLGPAAAGDPTAAAAVREDSGDGLDAGEVGEAASSTSGPLWPQTLKLWAGEHEHQSDEDDSHQDMALDMAAHPAQPATPSPAELVYRSLLESLPRLAPLPPLAPLPGGQEDYQDSVRESLAAMAGSLEGVERHLHALVPLAVLDADELFARSLAATLRRLPRATRAQAKMKLIAVLDEFDEGL